MKSRASVVLIGLAVLLTSGGVAASARAESISLNFTEIKIDYRYTAATCAMNGGTVLKVNGQDTCRLAKSGGPTTAPAGLKVELHDVLVSSTPVKPGQTTPANPR
jgi:hypothetical protein